MVMYMQNDSLQLEEFFLKYIMQIRGSDLSYKVFKYLEGYLIL